MKSVRRTLRTSARPRWGVLQALAVSVVYAGGVRHCVNDVLSREMRRARRIREKENHHVLQTSRCGLGGPCPVPRMPQGDRDDRRIELKACPFCGCDFTPYLNGSKSVPVPPPHRLLLVLRAPRRPRRPPSPPAAPKAPSAPGSRRAPSRRREGACKELWDWRSFYRDGSRFARAEAQG